MSVGKVREREQDDTVRAEKVWERELEDTVRAELSHYTINEANIETRELKVCEIC